MSKQLSITIINIDGTQSSISFDQNRYSNLMEVLVDRDFPVLATCGGMALCGTCCIDIVSANSLSSPEDDEIDMLDSLPLSNESSRLSCQLKISKDIDGLEFKLNYNE